MSSLPSGHPAEAGISLDRSDIPSIVRVYFWLVWQSFKVKATHWLSPIGFIGLFAIALEIGLEFADATGFLLHFTRAVSIGVLVVLVLLVGFKQAELREHRRVTLFLEKAAQAVAALKELASIEKEGPDDSYQSLKRCVELILQVLLDTFASRGSLNANVMLLEDDNGDNRLRMTFVRVAQGVEYDQNFKPRPGEGIAGRCFREKAIVYLPRVKWKHGIQVKLPKSLGEKTKYSFCPNLYVAIHEKFEQYYCSILCVPVVAYGRCFGVLNLDSANPGPFRESDYLAVTFFGEIIGIALARYERV